MMSSLNKKKVQALSPGSRLFWGVNIEVCCTGSMSQNHERNFYVMAFGLYFEVPVEKNEISKKSIVSVPSLVKNWGKWGFQLTKFENSKNIHDILI